MYTLEIVVWCLFCHTVVTILTILHVLNSRSHLIIMPLKLDLYETKYGYFILLCDESHFIWSQKFLQSFLSNKDIVILKFPTGSF